MNRLFGIFRLTSAEQRVIVILMLALLAVVIAQRHRETKVSTPLRQLHPAQATPGAIDPD